MKLNNVNWVTLIVSLLGAIKLTAQSFGYHIITDDQINAFANLIAVVVTILGVFLSHDLTPTTQQTVPVLPTVKNIAPVGDSGPMLVSQTQNASNNVPRAP